VTQPLLSAAGARSWPAFAKQARSVRIDELDDTCAVLASTRDAKGAFTPAPQHDVTLQRPSDRELGEAILRILALDISTGDM